MTSLYWGAKVIFFCVLCVNYNMRCFDAGNFYFFDKCEVMQGLCE